MSVPDQNGTQSILVVHDAKRAPGATQRISFSQPFPDDEGHHAIRVAFEHDREDPAEVAKAFALHRPDFLVLSRYTSAQGSHWIAAARGAQIPVVFHIDDDLLAVPASLGESKFKAYNNLDRLAALRQNIEASDLIYVSTRGLAERFGDYGFPHPIVAGDIYCSVAAKEIGALIGPATGPVIGYMGTGGHSADLAMILPAVCEIMDAIPALQFELFGTIAMPPALARFGKRVRHLPSVADYTDFIPRLRSIGWWIGLAPLEDNQFNRCKADTKWVEYSVAGMAVVASDLPVYHRACEGGCGILASRPEQWRDGILRLLTDDAARRAMVGRAQDKLQQFYTHERLRQQVLSVLNQAVLLRRREPATTPPSPALPASADALLPPER